MTMNWTEMSYYKLEEIDPLKGTETRTAGAGKPFMHTIRRDRSPEGDGNPSAVISPLIFVPY